LTTKESKRLREARKLFEGLPDKQKEIALRYLENKILGKDKENEKIKERLGVS